MIETTLPTGKVGVIVPHGVLFRGSAEQKIRQKLIEENLLEAVIGLPTNLFYGTGIPAAILIFNKAKTTEDILFVDASKEYDDGKKQNVLRPQDIERIVTTYKEFTTVEKYSSIVKPAEVVENDFNLNIPRYVDTFEEEEPVDIVEVQKNIKKLEEELVEVRSEMDKHLKELGFE
ncbi:MAG: type I restriction enzyme M protein [Patiriisocius sp.]|jgi:type I restriction enzyme M protein